MGLIESSVYKKFYIQRDFLVLDTNNKVITGVLTASFRVKNTYLREDTFIRQLGWLQTPPPSSDNPPKGYSISKYVSLNAASRNGWINEVGWTMQEYKKQPAPTSEIDDENYIVTELGDTFTRVNLYSASTWYAINKDLKTVAEAVYAMKWLDPYNQDTIFYKALPGSVHEIKHRKSTSYF